MPVEQHYHQQRGYTAADWVGAQGDPVLAVREVGYVTDTGEYVIGDGTTAFSGLTKHGLGGGGGSGAPVFAKAYATAATSIPHATFVEIDWVGAETDDYNFVDLGGANPERVTIPEGQEGWYEVGGVVSWAGNSTGRRIMQFHKNGATGLATYEEYPTAGSNSDTVSGTYFTYFNAGDYISMRVFQDSGSALALKTTDFDTSTGTDISAAIWLRKIDVTGGTASPEGFRATLSADQTGVLASTWTKVAFDTESLDQGNDFNTTTSTWTVPATGWYIVQGQIGFASVIDAERTIVSVRVNGAEAFRIMDVEHGHGGDPTIGGSRIHYFTSGDEVTLYGWREQAGNFNSNQLSTYFSAVPVSTTDAAALTEYADTVNALGNVTGTVIPNPSGGMWVTATLTGNTTFDLSNMTQGQTLTFDLTQDATGGFTVAFTQTVQWPGGTAFAHTGTANSRDRIVIDYNGSVYTGAVVGKGYA